MQPEQVEALTSGLHLTHDTNGFLNTDFALLHEQVDRLLGPCWHVARAGDGFLCDLLVGFREAFAKHPYAASVMPAVLRLRWNSFVGVIPPDEEWQTAYERLRFVDDAKCGRFLLTALSGEASGLLLSAGTLLNPLPFYVIELQSLSERAEGIRRKLLARLTPWLEMSRGAEETAFLDAMRAEADDLGRIAIYADWLDERGDVRAATVRAVFEVLGAATPADSDAVAAAQAGRQAVAGLPERLSDVSTLAQRGHEAWTDRPDPEERARFLERINQQSDRALNRLALLVAATFLMTWWAAVALRSGSVCLVGPVIVAALVWGCLLNWPRRLWA